MIRVALICAAMVAIAGRRDAPSENQTDGMVLGKEYLNAPIDFCFPYLGDMDECRVLDFSIGEGFSNGVVTVVLNGVTNTWTVVGVDRPMYKFGRYYCGFVREDRPDGGHSLYMTLFYDGEMIGVEKLRGPNSGTNTHAELEDIPEGIEQVGGGRWEAGFLLFHGIGTKWVDVNQMMIRHQETNLLSFELRSWLRKATDNDIRKEWNAIDGVIKAFYGMPSESNSDDWHIFGAAEKLKSQFFNALKYWKVHNAKTTNAKYDIIRAESDIEGIGKKCDAARRGGRGSHAWGDWGESLYYDLLMAWLLDGEDAECWNAVANMKGRIDKHNLEFVQGFATADLTLTKAEEGYGKEPLVLYKVQHDFYRDGEYVYAKVMGDEPSYCYMPTTYQPPTYVVKVDASGNIVKWYRYPQKEKTLKSFLGPATVPAPQEESPDAPDGNELRLNVGEDITDIRYYGIDPTGMQDEDYLAINFQRHNMYYKIGYYLRTKDEAPKIKAEFRHVCTDDEWRFVVSNLNAMAVSEWEENYTNIDGKIWLLRLCNGAKVVREYYGCNAWPKQFSCWGAVIRFIRNHPDFVAAYPEIAEKDRK